MKIFDIFQFHVFEERRYWNIIIVDKAVEVQKGVFEVQNNLLYFGGRKSLKYTGDHNTYTRVAGHCQDMERWRLRVDDVLKADVDTIALHQDLSKDHPTPLIFVIRSTSKIFSSSPSFFHLWLKKTKCERKWPR